MIGHVCVYFVLTTYKNRIRGLKVNIGIIFPTLSFDLQGCKGGTVICAWIYVAEEGLELSRVLIQGQDVSYPGSSFRVRRRLPLPQSCYPLRPKSGTKEQSLNSYKSNFKQLVMGGTGSKMGKCSFCIYLTN